MSWRNGFMASGAGFVERVRTRYARARPANQLSSRHSRNDIRAR
jgi:hypothetical protein